MGPVQHTFTQTALALSPVDGSSDVVKFNCNHCARIMDANYVIDPR